MGTKLKEPRYEHHFPEFPWLLVFWDVRRGGPVHCRAQPQGPSSPEGPPPHTCISPVRLGPTCPPSHQATSPLSFSPDPHHQAPPGPERHQGHPGLHGVRSDPRPPSDRQVLLRPRPLGGKRGGAAFGGRWLLAECPCREVSAARGGQGAATYRLTSGLRPGDPTAQKRP